MILVGKVFAVEYAYVIERFGGVPPGFRGHADFLVNFIGHRPELFFFFFVSGFTSAALALFCVHINTINNSNNNSKKSFIKKVNFP